ncbi:MAG: CRISPR-associated endonuclease Cas1 [Anaerolineae bacterium]|nr:CRISPR-associated endonuclease Cas1 [Anaerolineae bacterium]
MRLIIDTQGAQLRKEGERLLIQREKHEDESIPINVLEQVILAGRGVSASTPLLYDLVQRGVDVIYQSQRGHFGFRLVGPVAKHSALRVRQVQVCTDPARALPLARAMISGKLHNQRVILQRARSDLGDNWPAIHQTLTGQIHQAEQAANADSLRGHEGSGAAAYFAAWPLLLDAHRWHFHGRAYHPPPDPVNALLSLGYTLLLNDIIGAVYRIGLDPTIGVFHTIDYGRPSLALDLEEEFRPVIIDTLVLRLVRQAILDPTDFRHTDDQPGVLLSTDARRFFLEQYEERLTTRVRHPTWQQHLTYRQCLQRQVEHLARCILGRDEGYTPLLLK